MRIYRPHTRSCRRLAPVLAILAGLVGLAVPAWADVPQNIRFQRLGVEQGLSQAAVNTVLQDRWGFMWFGTQEGLNRWDGYTFTVFVNDPADPTSISNDWIWSLHEDSRGNLWVGTDGGGLNRFDPGTETFKRFVHDPADPTSLSNDRVRVLAEDSRGTLWVGTDGGGLNRLDRDGERGSFSRFVHDPANPTSLPNDRVRAVFEDRDGALWVGTDGGGLARFDAAKRSFLPFRHAPDAPSSLSDDRVRTIYQDQQGALWVGTYEGGLNRFDPATGAFTRYAFDADDPSSLPHNRVRAVLEDDDSTLWVGTDRGLSAYRPETDSFVRYLNDPADPASLGDDRVTRVYQDRGGVVWIATQGGTSRWNPHLGTFGHVTHDPDAENTLSGRIVFALHAESDDSLWVGTYGNGLSHIDRQTGEVTVYRHDPSVPGSLPDDRVMSLLVDDEGTVWVGTLSGGLARLDRADRARGHFTVYRHASDDPTSLSWDGVTVVFEDRQGVLWVGTYRGGLNRFDRASGSFHHYRHDPANPTSLSNDSVLALLEDSQGALWVGTDGGGLNRFDRLTGTFSRYRHDADDPQSLSSDVAWALHEDRQGVLWVGTREGGLNAWAPADRRAHRGVFRRYGRRDGLRSACIYAILEDARGELWLSTNRGISRLDPATGRLRHYDATHGLQGEEFNFPAAHQSAAGEMFFGGNNGFNAFFPERIGTNREAPPVVLTAIRKLNRKIEPGRPLPEVTEVELSHREPAISFEFAALDYTAPEKNRYRYRLDDFDADWIDLGTDRRATYTNLPPGRYRFRVQAANSDGVWNEAGAEVGLVVIPPWWRTWWAYGLYGALVLLAVAAYTRAQARKLQREAEVSRRLEQEVRARTGELERRNHELADVNKKLEEASVTDSLTGLKNRRFITSYLRHDLALIERHRRRIEAGEPGGGPLPELLFLMFDLDGLKGINDTYGHTVGDRVLIQVREVVEGVCRGSDLLVRWGGDEFLLVGRYGDTAASEGLAERVRRSLGDHEFDLGDGETVRLSCSIGFAHYPFDPERPDLLTWEQVLTVADHALYAAKKSGRDAWVGVRARAGELPADLFERLVSEPERLAGEGVIELRTSLPNNLRLVWSQQANQVRPRPLRRAAAGGAS